MSWSLTSPVPSLTAPPLSLWVSGIGEMAVTAPSSLEIAP